MPLPVAASSFQINPLTGPTANQMGFQVGQKSSDFANIVSGVFEGAEKTADVLTKIQDFQLKPQEVAQKDRQLEIMQQQANISKQKADTDILRQKALEEHYNDMEAIYKEQNVISRDKANAYISRQKALGSAGGSEASRKAIASGTIGSFLSTGDPIPILSALRGGDSITNEHIFKEMREYGRVVTDGLTTAIERGSYDAQTKMALLNLRDKLYALDKLNKIGDPYSAFERMTGVLVERGGGFVDFMKPVSSSKGGANSLATLNDTQEHIFQGGKRRGQFVFLDDKERVEAKKLANQIDASERLLLQIRKQQEDEAGKTITGAANAISEQKAARQEAPQERPVKEIKAPRNAEEWRRMEAEEKRKEEFLKKNPRARVPASTAFANSENPSDITDDPSAQQEE